MRLIGITLFILTLAGCAQLDAPQYDFGSRAIIAQDYAIQRLEIPEGFQIIDKMEADEAFVFTLTNLQNRAVKIVYLKQKLNPKSSGMRAEGYISENVPPGIREGFYRYHTGLFKNLVSLPHKLPHTAERCATGAGVFVPEKTKARHVFLFNFKGHPCDDKLNTYEQYQLRRDAYEMLGFRK